MNDKHKQRALFDAVTGIDENLIEEAAAPRMLAFPRRVLRVAAIAAVLALLLTWLSWPGTEESYITGPGLLVVRAYAMDEDTNTPIEEVILEEGVEFAPYIHYYQGMSRTQYVPFEFSVDESLYPGMEITMEITTDAGIFRGHYNYDLDDFPRTPDQLTLEVPDVLAWLLMHSGQHFTTDIDTTIYWEPYGFDYDYLKKEIENVCWTPSGLDVERLEREIESGNFDVQNVLGNATRRFVFETNPAFIDVIIRADDHIVGYCIIEICDVDGYTGPDWDDWHFSFTMLTKVSFPQVDGQWQSVTKEYVTQQIQQIHENAKSVRGDSG